MNFYTRSFHQMPTRLCICVLTVASLEFQSILLLSFPLYLHWTFSVFLLEKTLFLTLYPLSFTIIGLGLFWPSFFLPVLCVRFRPSGEVSKFIFDDIVSISKLSVASSSVSTITWTKRQFQRECYLCLSISSLRFWTFLLITDTFSSKFLIICFSYSSNFVHIRLTASF